MKGELLKTNNLNSCWQNLEKEQQFKPKENGQKERSV